MKNLESSRLFKEFELNESKLSTVIGGAANDTGGTYEEACEWSEGGNPACSHECPDSMIDVRAKDTGKIVSTK